MSKNEQREEFFRWYAMMMGALSALPPSELAALDEWEKHYLPRGLATSDWPGWINYIGPHPAGPMPPRGKSRLKIAARTKQSIPASLRWQVWERDNFTCQRCGSRKHLEVDHILAESKGGPLSIDNLQTLCKPCNLQKGAR